MVYENLKSNLNQAFAKYGNELYNANIISLQKEYGIETFPDFVLTMCMKLQEILNLLEKTIPREELQLYYFIENFCQSNLNPPEAANIIKTQPESESENITEFLNIIYDVLNENQNILFSKDMFHEWFLQFIRTKYDISAMPKDWSKDDSDNIIEYCPQLTLFGSSSKEYTTFQNEDGLFRIYGDDESNNPWLEEYDDPYELCTYFDEYYNTLPKLITRMVLRSNGNTIKDTVF
jgi:hypothetical protein